MDDGAIVDRLTVEDLASAIDRAVDEKNWDFVLSCMADTVEVDVGALSGGEIQRLDRDLVVAGIRSVNPPDKACFHARYNIVTRVDGDKATMSAHSYGWNLCDLFSPPVYEVWGTMDYRFARIGGSWRVTAITMGKWREAGNRAVNEYCG